MMRKIIHVDMDCFFAAVEMRDNPALRDIPIAIGGSRVQRGVISTANYPARKFGVRSAMPTAMALKLCPHLTLLPGRFEAYKEASHHIREIFSRYTSLIEPLSLDEAYLDVTDSLHCHGSATLMAQEIRQTIFDELQLTASAGIAPVKFLAKIASDLNKPNGQYVITPDEVPAFIKTLPLGKIPGVGKVSAAKLENMGLRTCGDVQNSDLSMLLKRFGKFGRVLWERSQGIDERNVNSERLRKSVGVERTLAEDIHDWAGGACGWWGYMSRYWTRSLSGSWCWGCKKARWRSRLPGLIQCVTRRPGKRSAAGQLSADYLAGIAFSSSVSRVQ